MTEHVGCPRCQIGNLHAEKATYTCIHNGMLLSVADMPAWKCDICQYTEFDYGALTQIEALTGHMGIPEDPVRPASKLPAVDTESTETKLPHRLKP